MTVPNQTYAKFRKKPVVIEAVRYMPPDTCEEVARFTGTIHDMSECGPDTQFFINTFEGTMAADPGDWIIKGVKGEFYPCKPDIFEATYERA